MLERLLERGLGDADAARRDVDPAEREAADGLVEAAPFRADQIARRHAVVVEHELGRVDALVAELLELAARAESGPLLAEEHRHAAVARLGLRVGLREDREAGAVDP